ncbi:beach domain-containing protein lvsc [Anaeramoeba ignava]|uniref:Beach domain-containing protein lvsc n=1 Tax=Anaeramoeba ignava TaxID=1746090 RepID=A0A9Q0L9N0_ANAIG|nr:beach domain-containing protein lvsc [Anaeramoeba ignava]
MSLLKNLFKLNLKRIKDQKLFSFYFSTSSNQKKLQELWKERENQQSNKIQSFISFSKLFLNSYSKWNPNLKSFQKNEENFQKNSKKLNNKEEFIKIIQKDLIHPVDLISEVIHYINIFCYEILVKFKFKLDDQEKNKFLEPPLKSKNRIEKIQKESLSFNEYSLNSQFQIGISLEMTKILSKSFYNQDLFLHLNLFDSICYLFEISNNLISKFLEEKIENESTEYCEIYYLVDFIMNSILEIYSNFLESQNEFQNPFFKINRLFTEYKLIENLEILLKNIKEIESKFNVTIQFYDLHLCVLDFFRMINQKYSIPENQIKSLISLAFSNLKPPPNSLPHFEHLFLFIYYFFYSLVIRRLPEPIPFEENDMFSNIEIFDTINYKLKIFQKQFKINSYANIVCNPKIEQIFHLLNHIYEIAIQNKSQDKSQDKDQTNLNSQLVSSIKNKKTEKNIKYSNQIDYGLAICHRIIDSLLNIFNDKYNPTESNQKSRDYILNFNCELQFFVLNFFSDLILRKLLYVHNLNLWNTLFSKYFYYRVNELCFQDLQNFLFQFFYLSSQEGNLSKEQIQILLQFCHQNHSNIETLLHLLRLLMNVLLLRSNEVTNLIQTSGIDNTLYRIIQDLQQIHMENIGNKQESFPYHFPTFIKLRYLLLELLNILIEKICKEQIVKNTKSAIITLCKILKPLSNLVVEAETRQFALKHIQNILFTIDENLQSDAILIFEEVISLIVRLKDKKISILNGENQNNQIENAQIIQKILQKISNILKQKPKPLQNILIKSGIFDLLISLIQHQNIGNILVIDVLDLLKSLFHKSRKTPQMFKEKIGSQKFAESILIAENEKPREEIYKILLDMMVEEGGFEMESNFIIQNPEIVTIIFHVFAIKGNEFLPSILDTFCELCEKSVHNRACCSNVGLISFLVKLIPIFSDNQNTQIKITKLIGIIGSQRVIVKELKLFFSLLKSLPGNFRPPYSALILSAMKQMSQKQEEGPKVFFNFKSKNASLSIPKIPKWPQKGYSFCTWIRFETFQDSFNQKSQSYQHLLFYFYNDKSQGIESLFRTSEDEINTNKQQQITTITTTIPQNTYNDSVIFPLDSNLENDNDNYNYNISGINDSITKTKSISTKHTISFVLRISSNANQTEFIQIPFEIDLRKWYFVSIIHTPSRWSSTAEVKLFLNGKFINSSFLKYPKLQNLSNNIIGNKLDGGESFLGQIGTIYFFNDGLSQTQIEEIYQLGPKYMYSFHPSELNESFGKLWKKFSIFDGELNSKIFLNYNIKASNDIHCFDQSPQVRKDQQDKAKLSGMFKCITTSIYDIVYCIGGVKVFFPLIIQLDQPIGTPENINFGKLKEMQNIDYSIDPELSKQIFDIIVDILVHSSSNQEDMVRSDGFAIISFLFKNINSKYITYSIIESTKRLILTVQNSAFLKDLIENFILNYDHWIYSDFEIQKELIDIIKMINSSQKNFNKNNNNNNNYKTQNNDEQYIDYTIKIQDLIDIIQFYFWKKPQKFSRAKIQEKYHPVTGEIISKRPNETQIENLRKEYLHLIRNNDMILNFLEQIQRMFLHNFENCVRLLEENHFMDPFIALINSSNQEVGEFCLKILCQLHHQCLKYQREQKIKNQSHRNESPSTPPQHGLGKSAESPKMKNYIKDDSDNNICGKLHSRFSTKSGVQVFLGVVIKLEFTEIVSSLLFFVLTGNDLVIQKIEKKAEAPRIINIYFLQVLFHMIHQSRNEKSSFNKPNWPQIFLYSFSFDALQYSFENQNENQNRPLSEINNYIFKIFGVILVPLLLENDIFIQQLEKVLLSINLFFIKTPKAKDVTTNLFFKSILKIFDKKIKAAIQEELEQIDDQEKNQNIQNEIKLQAVSKWKNNPNFIHSLTSENIAQELRPLSKLRSSYSLRIDRKTQETVSHRKLQTSQKRSTLSKLLKKRKDDNYDGDDDEQKLKNQDIQLGKYYRKIPKTKKWEDEDLVIELLNVIKQVHIFEESMTYQDGKLLVDVYNIMLQLILILIEKSDEFKIVQYLSDFQDLFIFSKLFIPTDGENYNLQFPLNTINSSCWKDGILFTLYKLFRYVISQEIPQKQNPKNLNILQTITNTNDSVDTDTKQEKNTDSFSPVNLTKYETLIYFIQTLFRDCWGFLSSMLVDEKEELLVGIQDINDLPTKFVYHQYRINENAKWKIILNEKIFPEYSKFVNQRQQEKITQIMEFNQKMGNMRLEQEGEESKLFSASQKTQKKIVQWSDTKWREILRSLTNERGPWGNQDQDQQKEKHWKIDKIEDNSRRRKKMKINYHFDSHFEASIRRDKGTETEMERLIKEHQQRIRVSDKFKSITSGIQMIPEYKTKENSAFSKNIDENDISEKSSFDLYSESQQSNQMNNMDSTQKKEAIIFHGNCEMIKPLAILKGALEISGRLMKFYVYSKYESYHSMNKNSNKDENSPNQSMESEDEVKVPTKIYTWEIDNIKEIYKRRYLLRQSALEFFMIDHTNFFVNLELDYTNIVFHKIIEMKPEHLLFQNIQTPKRIFKQSQVVQQWQRRQLSNFEYLMKLNTIAGRSYNDISQYPIFPWILSNYESETIDLSDPKNYRDLSLPVGALNAKRIPELDERYNEFKNTDIPPFHYGSHYSSSGIVLFYLIRLEPFTTLSIKLQGGKFDSADRLFWTIRGTWSFCYNEISDVKELIPEFFYLPEFLYNSNNFDFGRRQSKEKIDDCILPPWAKTAEDFIRINKESLESDYVSEHLNEWIDLIFGYKQRGKAAVEARNVFYYLTYEDMCNIDNINDPNERESIVSQIENFGQTPTQLLTKPHAKRYSRQHILESISSSYLYWRIKEMSNIRGLTIDVVSNPIIFIAISKVDDVVSFLGIPDHIIIVDSSRDVLINSWSITPIITQSRNGFTDKKEIQENNQQNQRSPSIRNRFQEIPQFTFEIDPLLHRRPKIGVTFDHEIKFFQNCLTTTETQKLLISCGFWDDSFKLTNLESMQLIQSNRKHKDIVTCLKFEKNILVTGSRDTTVMLWKFNTKIGQFDQEPINILYGHDDEVNCVDISTNLDVVVSGSKDGTVIIHTLNQGKYVRSIFDPQKNPIDLLSLSSEGHIVMFSEKNSSLSVYSINAKLLCSKKLVSHLNCWVISKDSEFLLVGTKKGNLEVLYLHNLEVYHSFFLGHSISAITLSENERYLLAGLENGKLFIGCFVYN